MRIKFGKLILHNIFRIRHLEVDLGVSGLCLVEGQNGDTGQSNESGKTSIFNGLSWTVFGRFPGASARPGDEIVNPLEKRDAYGEVLIIIGNETATIRRTRMEGEKHKDSRLYITHKGAIQEHDLRQNNISDSNQWINNFLGLDYDGFIRQRYFAQEDVRPVTRMKNTELKSFCLENLLSIDWTHRALEKCRDDISKTKAHIATAEARREGSLRQLLSRHEPLRSHKRKLTKWEEEEKQRQVELAEELQEAVQLLGQARKENKKVEKKIAETEKRHNKEAKILQKKLDSMALPKNLDSEIEDLERQLRKVTAEKAKIEVMLSQAEIKKDQLQKKMEDATSQVGQKCESCGSKITKKHIPFMTKELGAEIDAIGEKAANWASALFDYQSSAAGVSVDLERLKKERQSHQKARDAYGEIRLEIARAQTVQMKEFNVLKEDLIDVDVIDKEILRITKEQEKARENPYLELIAQEKKEMKEHVTAIREWKIKELGHKEDLKVAQVWEKAFSSKIQAWLLNDITAVVNKFIAGYMMELADGRITAMLHTVKKLKSGEYREDFGLHINNMDGGSTFASLSGGAKRRVDLAVSLAIADFQRALSDKQLDFIVLDEYSAFLDNFWEARFFQMIKKRFGKISAFIVSHKEVDYTMFDRVIRVIKKNGETKLENR